VEWDLTSCTPEELAQLRAWAGLYREARGLLHSGVTVRADLHDPSLVLHGVVAQDGSEALFALVRTTSGAARWPGRMRLPGLDPARRYAVRLRPEVGFARRHQNADPVWLAAAVGDALEGAPSGTGLEHATEGAPSAPALEGAGGGAPSAPALEGAGGGAPSAPERHAAPTPVLTGETLTRVGVPLPTLAVTNALVLHLTALP
ncbi:MAG: hypothetical protein GX593_13235, partial [Actinomycetales bacterium]|nr:hypothetical protein [Actinomycetales bacterium]